MDEDTDLSASGYDDSPAPGYDDSPAPTRNPSPPPEFSDNAEAMADFITGTLISKKWIFSILLRLIQEVDKSKEAQEGGEESEFGADVDEEQQDELCQLWDMSMNPEVAKFLQEFKAVSILAKVINQSRAPRINEICVGILGNMCCIPELCKEMAENETFLSLVTALLSNTEFDPLTLKETMRLVYTCLSNEEVCPIWVRTIGENPHVAELVRFVLQSSTNNELLKSTGDMMDVLLDVSDELCQKWASSALVEAVLEAIHQIGYHDSEELQPFMHVFQLLSTSQQGVQALVENAESVLEPLLHHLSYVCDYEIVSVEDHLPCLCSVISIIHVLITSDSSVADKLSSKSTLLGQMLKILDGVFHASSHYGNALGIPDPARTGAARQDSTEDETTRLVDRRSADRRSMDRQHSEEQPHVSASRADSSSRKEGGGESSKKKGEEDGRAERRGGDGDGEKKKEGEGDGEDAHASEKQQLRILFELLQAFFLDFVDTLKLYENPPQTESSNKDKTTNPPLFLPILSFLDRRRRPFLGYLVHTLVHTLPVSASSDSVPQDGHTAKTPASSGVSERGKAAVMHLRRLCEKFKLTRAVRLLNEAMEDVS